MYSTNESAHGHPGGSAVYLWPCTLACGINPVDVAVRARRPTVALGDRWLHEPAIFAGHNRDASLRGPGANRLVGGLRKIERAAIIVLRQRRLRVADLRVGIP